MTTPEHPLREAMRRLPDVLSALALLALVLLWFMLLATEPEPVCELIAPALHPDDGIGCGGWTLQPEEATHATHPPRATPEEPAPYTPEPEQVR